MIKYQFFPRSRGVTEDIDKIIQCFIKVDNSKGAEHLKSNEMLDLLRPYLENIGFRVEHGKKENDKIDVPVLFGENNTIDKSFYADALSNTDVLLLRWKLVELFLIINFSKIFFKHV